MSKKPRQREGMTWGEYFLRKHRELYGDEPLKPGETPVYVALTDAHMDALLAASRERGPLQKPARKKREAIPEPISTRRIGMQCGCRCGHPGCKD